MKDVRFNVKVHFDNYDEFDVKVDRNFFDRSHTPLLHLLEPHIYHREDVCWPKVVENRTSDEICSLSVAPHSKTGAKSAG